jgi:formylmethanofuran dehydrogenase subunit E
MKIKLKAFAEESNDMGKYFRFAVIDTEKSCEYPSNFVCLLPTVINNEEKTQNAFSKMFGEKSQEQAELLLVKALRNESEGIVKDEIGRRLALIVPKKYLQIRCLVCGKFFYQGRAKKLKSALCGECFGNRT